MRHSKNYNPRQLFLLSMQFLESNENENFQNLNPNISCCRVLYARTAYCALDSTSMIYFVLDHNSYHNSYHNTTSKPPTTNSKNRTTNCCDRNKISDAFNPIPRTLSTSPCDPCPVYPSEFGDNRFQKSCRCTQLQRLTTS